MWLGECKDMWLGESVVRWLSGCTFGCMVRWACS